MISALHIKCLALDILLRFQGDSTTGWNFATVTDQRLAKLKLASQTKKAMSHSHSQAAKLKAYQTPMENSAAVARQVKAAKEASAMQLEQLQRKYGKDGAAAMQQIMLMTPLKYKWVHKVALLHHSKYKLLQVHTSFSSSEHLGTVTAEPIAYFLTCEVSHLTWI